MAEKSNININQQNSKFGIGVVTGDHNIINVSEQDLVEATRKIQELLTQLAQTYPTKTEAEQQVFLQRFDDRTRVMPHVASILVVGGIEGIKLLCPPAGIPIEMERKLYEILMKNRERSQNG